MQPLWWATKDGDRTCLELANRHYSALLQKAKRGRIRKLFVGPGTKRVYRTWEGDACFVWLEHIDDGGQEGIYCSLFRNESAHRASELVRQADAIADHIWPNRRHYTFIDAKSVRRSRTPGRCFLKAGWQYAGTTKDGKLILERSPLSTLSAEASGAQHFSIEIPAQLQTDAAVLSDRKLSEPFIGIGDQPECFSASDCTFIRGIVLFPPVKADCSDDLRTIRCLDACVLRFHGRTLAQTEARW